MAPRIAITKNRFPSARPPAQSAVRSSETRLRRLLDEEQCKVHTREAMSRL